MLISRISQDLGIDEDFIFRITKNSSKHYKTFYINKNNGKKRVIHHPSQSLKVLQYWLVNNIFNEFPISKYATAYKKGSSIKKNALNHVNNKHLLHLDIKNFFESITKKHLTTLILKNKKLPKEDIELICKICLYKENLTIGSVSSPIISNCVMYSFDEEIRRILDDSITYTRYADDMIFSSKKYLDEDIIDTVSKLLLKNSFFLNKEKTRFMSPKGRRTVTGIVINGQDLSIGYKKHNELKSKIYKKLKYNIGNGQEILGHLFYVKDIEPELFNKLILKYSIFGNVIEILKEDKKNQTIGLKEVAATSDVQ